MTDAPRPLCSVCGVPLVEERSRISFRLYCPKCGHEHAFYQTGMDAVPQFILDHEKRIAALESKWAREVLDSKAK